jgi:hypothetical protein
LGTQCFAHSASGKRTSGVGGRPARHVPAMNFIVALPHVCKLPCGVLTQGSVVMRARHAHALAHARARKCAHICVWSTPTPIHAHTTHMCAHAIARTHALLTHTQTITPTDIEPAPHTFHSAHTHTQKDSLPLTDRFACRSQAQFAQR